MELKKYYPIESDREIRLLDKHIKSYNQKTELGFSLREQHIATAKELVKIALQEVEKGEVDFSKATHLMTIAYDQKIDIKDFEPYKAGVIRVSGAAIAKHLNLKAVKTFDAHLKRLKIAQVACMFKDPIGGRSIRAGGKNAKQTLVAINSVFFNY